MRLSLGRNEIAKQLTIGLLDRMRVKTDIEGFLKEKPSISRSRAIRKESSLENMVVPWNRFKCLLTEWSIKD